MSKKLSTKVGDIRKKAEKDEHNFPDLGLGEVVDKTKEKDFDDMLHTRSINDLADTIDNKMSDVEQTLRKEKEETRSQIGTIFVWGFFGCLFVVVVGVIVYNIVMYNLTGSTESFLNIGDIVPIIGSVIGTPLGFVMGYYFKGD